MTNNIIQLVKTLVKTYLEVKSMIDTVKQEIFGTVLETLSELSIRKLLAESIYFQDDDEQPQRS